MLDCPVQRVKLMDPSQSSGRGGGLGSDDTYGVSYLKSLRAVLESEAGILDSLPVAAVMIPMEYVRIQGICESIG